MLYTLGKDTFFIPIKKELSYKFHKRIHFLIKYQQKSFAYT